MRTLTLLAALACAGPAPAEPLPATGKAEPELAAFDELMRTIIRDTGVPGGALAVTKNGRLVYARGFGHADRGTKAPVEPDSRFRIASVSKPLTTAAVLKLFDAGRLRPGDKVFPLLKLEPLPGHKLDPRWHDVTVQHLLDHKGGFDRAASGDPMFLPWKIAKAGHTEPPPGPREVIRYMLGRPLDFAPGEKSVYSNFGYCVLGRVIEAVTGEPYGEHVHKSILNPLGIGAVRLGKTRENGRLPGEVTYTCLNRPTSPSVFDPHRKHLVPTPYGGWYIEAMDAHGGWVASMPELVKFLTTLADPERHPAVRGPHVQAEFKPGYGFEGYLDGASTGFHWMNVGNVTFAASFNGTAGLGKDHKSPATRLSEGLPPLVRAVAAWPAGDLFERNGK